MGGILAGLLHGAANVAIDAFDKFVGANRNQAIETDLRVINAPCRMFPIERMMVYLDAHDIGQYERFKISDELPINSIRLVGLKFHLDGTDQHFTIPNAVDRQKLRNDDNGEKATRMRFRADRYTVAISVIFDETQRTLQFNIAWHHDDGVRTEGELSYVDNDGGYRLILDSILLSFE